MSLALHLKAVTRLLPHYCGPTPCTNFISHDEQIGIDTLSIDLGELFWREKLDELRLFSLVEGGPRVSTEGVDSDVSRQLDACAIRALPEAKAILGSLSERLPTARELWFCFRVISRCVAIGSRFERGFQLHMARGLIIEDFRQYVLSDVLEAARDPQANRVGRLLESMLARSFPAEKLVSLAIINLRNDGELSQAILLASMLKGRHPGIVIVLDTSGGNEQFDFGSWTKAFFAHCDKLAPFIDYFLPRQDYKDALRLVVASTLAGQRVAPNIHPNVVVLNPGSDSNFDAIPALGGGRIPSITAADIGQTRSRLGAIFEDYLRHQKVFSACGQRSLAARVSPNRCHWAACSFCTINTQHLLPRSGAGLDAQTQRNIEIICDLISENRVQSAIFTDEALQPEVLLWLAERLIQRRAGIVYRARSRFAREYTASKCQLLFESGCRYLGLGLEAASPRVNRLVNKHNGPPLDYQELIDNLEGSGIRTHVYSIMGLPTETAEEIGMTRDFLLANIRRHRFVTVSANQFFLMRGSGIADAPEAFEVQIEESPEDIALVLAFHEQHRQANQGLAVSAAQEIYNEIFLPHVEDPVSAESFWNFVDQTGIFYLQKVLYRDNPYHKMAYSAGAGDLKRQYCRSKTSRIEGEDAEGRAIFIDWVTHNYVRVPDTLVAWFCRHDASLDVITNIHRFVAPESHALAIGTFSALVEAGFFYDPSESESSDDLVCSSSYERAVAVGK